MNSVIEDIRLMLEADSSLGLVFNDNLFLYKEPAKPDNTVSLFETPGMPPVGLLSSNEDTKHYERPSFQLRVRHRQADLGFAQALEIATVLQAQCNETWGSYYYSLIYSVTHPYMMDWDDVNRIRIVMNFNVQRRLT